MMGYNKVGWDVGVSLGMSGCGLSCCSRNKSAWRNQEGCGRMG